MRISRYAVWSDNLEGPEEVSAVFSGMSGTLIRLHPGEREAIERFVATGETTLDPARLRQFVEWQLLVSSNHDERERLRHRYDISRHDASSLDLTLVTSLGCNFDCPYCYESKRPSLMNAEVQRAVLALVDDCAPVLRNLSVTWMGGEPLLGKASLFDLSDEFISRCDERDITFEANIITNGWLLDQATARHLNELHCSSAQVTIDGPPDTHNKMRPRVGGDPTFDRIVANLVDAADEIDISVRVNIDVSNLARVDELFRILRDAGLSDRITVYPGKMTSIGDNPDAPMATYEKRCYTGPEFANVELEFTALAREYGFAQYAPPGLAGVPCTAVAGNGLVIGSEGEIWKCWDDIGDNKRVLGNVRNYRDLNQEGLLPWLTYHPLDDPQCRECIALPTCMGGCLHRTMQGAARDAQCGTFRFNHVERVNRSAREFAGLEPRAASFLMIEEAKTVAQRGMAVPVTIGRRPVSL